MPKRDFKCDCGKMSWQVEAQASGSRLVCYCKDCQAFANHLARAATLDAEGGTHIFQTLPRAVSITKGHEALACLRLGPKGLIRWYAGCCRTPIANTLPRLSLPFVGVIVPHDTDAFGSIKGRVQTASARGRVKEFGFAKAGFALLMRGLGAKLAKRTETPFFDASGEPCVAPVTLSREERAKATP